MGALAFVSVEEVERVSFLLTWSPSSITLSQIWLELLPPHLSSNMTCGTNMIPRSSNIAEGWHHGFHSMLSCYNPTLWKFLDALKSEQALTDQKLAQRKLRQLPEPRAPKRIKYDQRLQKIADDFESYTNVLDYLEAAGNMTMLK